MTQPKVANLLEQSGLPIAYPVDARRVISSPDPEEFEIGVRTAVRSVTVMQKEAIVARTESDQVWRLASDEGPYLQGHDFAPAPLAYLVTGLAVDVLDNVARSLDSAANHSRPRVVLDSGFTMEGSLPRGTMVGGALAPQITVFAGGEDRSLTIGAVLSGVRASASAGVVGSALRATFSLTSRGIQVAVGRVAPLGEVPPPEGKRPPRFPNAGVVSGHDTIVTKRTDVGPDTADAGASLHPEQKRELHLRAEASRLRNGMTVVDTSVLSPIGSTFRFLSDESPGDGGAGRAPDALTYVSAGIGLCFMTQIGRYAKILRRSLGDYHIVQDTRFSPGDPAAQPPTGGRSGAPRTHVYLAPDEESFAAEALDMSEQTCFVHAMCRTELRPKVTILPCR